MYLFVSFTGAGDEVVLKKSSDFDFDLQTYVTKINRPLLNSMMKADPRLAKRCIHEAIEEYLIEYGYNRTFNKLAKTKKRAEEPWLAIKDVIRKSLIANDFSVARLMIANSREFVRDSRRLNRTIAVLELLYLMRKKKPIKTVVDFMSKRLSRYKQDSFELLDKVGKAQEVQLKVGRVDVDHHRGPTDAGR